MALDLKWDFLFRRKREPQAPNIFTEAAIGARARALMDSDVYRSAVTSVREGIHLRWASSPVADKDGQHELRLMLKLLDDLEANILEVADTGKLAARQIEEEQQRNEKRKRA